MKRCYVAQRKQKYVNYSQSNIGGIEMIGLIFSYGKLIALFIGIAKGRVLK